MLLKTELGRIGKGGIPKILFPEHHLSHAASAFSPSPFQEAAIVTIDGVGEWATTTLGHGSGNDIQLLRQLDFPHSLGLFYSAFTYYCGFKVNSGEYKLMGLAPYGNPDAAFTKEVYKKIRDHLVDVRRDGSLLLNMSYFNFATGLTMCREDKRADLLSRGNVVGWFQGRMEYGPRALGNRSILGDPGNPDMQKKLNLKIKYREGFRPFAPSVLEEEIGKSFDLDRPSPYMLLVAPVSGERRKPLPENYGKMGMHERLYQLRSDIPAVTHVDFSARIQSVSKTTNHRYWSLIHAFKKKTGIGLLVNTSFNVRGEPIVCSPEDAYRCFMRTEMDILVIGNCLFRKSQQPPFQNTSDLKAAFAAD